NVTAITPVLIAKVQAMHEKRRTTNRSQHGANSRDSNREFQEPYYEWHRSTETALDYAVTFDIRPDTGPAKRSGASRMIPPMFRCGKKPDMEFKGEFLEFRIYRDGQLLEPIMPGRQVVEGTEEEKRRHLDDQAYGGNYIYSPDEFMTGNVFRMQIIDAPDPNAIHKEVTFTANSKLIQQLRADFSMAPGVQITQAP